MKNLIALFFLLLAVGVSAQMPNDCVNAITVCGNGVFSSNAEGIGNLQEVSGCSGAEHNSIWLKINIVQSGTLGFHIRPVNPAIEVDYDFWVYGPDRSCDNLGSPIRCATTNPQMAGLANNHTGMYGQTTATTTGPGATGNGYVRWLTVAAGQSYYIAIDRPEGDGGFELEWIGTATNGTGAFPSFDPLPAVPEQITCSNTPDVGLFDLTSFNTLLNPNYDPVLHTVNYYSNLADATDRVNALPVIFVNETNPQTIYASLTNNGTGCSGTTTIDLRVVGLPTASMEVTQPGCDGGEVTLAFTGTPLSQVEYVLGGTTAFLLLDANGEASTEVEVTVATTVELVKSHVVNAAGEVVCSQLINQTATIQPATALADPIIVAPLTVCSGDQVDLMIQGTPGSEVSYVLNNVPGTAILDEQGNFVLPLLIEISTLLRINSVGIPGNPDCTRTVNISHLFTVNQPPVIMDLIVYTVCAELNGSAPITLSSVFTRLSNNPSYFFAAYATYEEAVAHNPANQLPAVHTIYENTTIFVRVWGASGCPVISAVPVAIATTPDVSSMNPIRACTSPGQQTALIDLAYIRNQMLLLVGGPVDIDFFHTVQDAELDQNVIVISFENELQEGNIYVRLTYNDCARLVPFDVVFTNPPAVQNSVEMAQCFELTAGFATFDLTTTLPTILQNTSPDDVEVRYYTTQTSRDYFLEDHLTNPSAFENTIPDQQSIYVAVKDLVSGCISKATLFLEVINPIDVPTDRNAYNCDSSNNGTTTFDLNAYHAVFMPEVPNPNTYEFAYYLSEQAALVQNQAQLLNPLYTISSEENPTIWVRFTHLLAGCSQVSNMTLVPVVLPAETGFELPALLGCAPSLTDVTQQFDLTTYDLSIRSGLNHLQLSYHPTLADAQNNTQVILDVTQYHTPSTNVYVRVVHELDVNENCAPLIYTLPLQVIEVPQIAQNNLTICDPFTNGYTAFPIAEQIPGILGNLPMSSYQVRFFVDEALTQAITTPTYTNQTIDQQTIYVQIRHIASGCQAAYPFVLRVQEGIQVTTPEALVVCDDGDSNDGFQVVDLRQIEPTLLQGLIASEYQVTYHLSFQTADQGTQTIANPSEFVNTVANGQTIYVRVRGLMPTNNCYMVIQVPLRVQKLLIPQVVSFDNQHTICVDYETGEVQRTLMLRSSLTHASYTYQWYFNGAAIANATSSTYLIETASPGNYAVQVVDPTAEIVCESPLSADFEVIQSSAPVLVDYSSSEPFQYPSFIQVNVTGFGEYGFQLDNGPILFNGGRFEGVDAGVHTVRVYDMTSTDPTCGSIEIGNIAILDYPRFFTPNQDGFNDYWTIPFLQQQPEAIIHIFDRYGKLLVVLQPSSNLGWDGTVEGRVLPATDYWFVVRFRYNEQLREYRSHFSLKR